VGERRLSPTAATKLSQLLTTETFLFRQRNQAISYLHVVYILNQASLHTSVCHKKEEQVYAVRQPLECPGQHFIQQLTQQLKSPDRLLANTADFFVLSFSLYYTVISHKYRRPKRG